MEKRKLERILKAHSRWIFDHNARYAKFANLSNANLRNANLSGADLRDANLRGANLDYSSGLPLWCGGTNIKIDRNIWLQLAYHLCSHQIDDEEIINLRNKMLETVNKSHVVKHHFLPILIK